MKNSVSTVQVVSDVTTHNVEVLEVNTDASTYSRLGWAIVVFGVLGFFLWASFAPLDKGVPLSGTVAVSSSKKMIQNQTNGTVDAILVKDGDIVKAGQVLLQMNSVVAKSAAEIAQVQLYTAQATEARLLAERAGAASIAFPKDLIQAKGDIRVANNILLQQQLFSSRQSSLQNELAAVDENIAGFRSQLVGLQESMVSKKQQQQFLKEQLDGVRDLAKDGYVARNRLLDLERTYAQVNGGISEDIGNMGRVSRQITELGLRKAQRQQDYQKEVRAQLSEVQKDVESLQSRVVALDYELKNIEIKAPVDGYIADRQLQIGAIASGAKPPLFSIVQINEGLRPETPRVLTSSTRGESAGRRAARGRHPCAGRIFVGVRPRLPRCRGWRPGPR